MNHLTPGESAVYDQMCKGLSNQKIADHLGFTLKAVKSYASAVYKKLDVHSRAEFLVKVLK